jgi:hypothetical protein
MLELPQSLASRIESYVMRDLEPPWFTAHLKVAIAASLGGLLSLFICGQFGIGFTESANAVNHAIHRGLGDIPCALFCGTLFSIFPVLVLRFVLCRPLEFRAIMQRRRQIVAVWFAGFGAIAATLGSHGSAAALLAIWVISALVAANVFAYIFYFFAPSWTWRPVRNNSFFSY